MYMYNISSIEVLINYTSFSVISFAILSAGEVGNSSRSKKIHPDLLGGKMQPLGSPDAVGPILTHLAFFLLSCTKNKKLFKFEWVLIVKILLNARHTMQGSFARWLRDFLSNRTARVQTNGRMLATIVGCSLRR